MTRRRTLWLLAFAHAMASAACEGPSGGEDAMVDAAAIDAGIDADHDATEIDATDATEIDATDAAEVDAAIDAPPVDAAIDAPPVDAAVDAVPLDAPPITGPYIAATLPPCLPQLDFVEAGVFPWVTVSVDGYLRVAAGETGNPTGHSYLWPWPFPITVPDRFGPIAPVDDGRVLMTGNQGLRFVTATGTAAPSQALPLPPGLTLSPVTGVAFHVTDGTFVVGGNGALWRLDEQALPRPSFGTGGAVRLPETALYLAAWPRDSAPTRLVASGVSSVFELDPATGAVLSTWPNPVISHWGVAVTADGVWVIGRDAAGAILLAPVGGGPATQLGMLADSPDPYPYRHALVEADHAGRLLAVVPTASAPQIRIVRVDPARFDGVDPASRLDPTFCGGELIYQSGSGPIPGSASAYSTYLRSAGVLVIAFMRQVTFPGTTSIRSISIGLPP